MFEIGFTELCMVALVALHVIGPEKLPNIARMAGFWIGKSKRMVASVKTELEEEFRAEELRQLLKEQKLNTLGMEKLLQDGINVPDLIEMTEGKLPNQK